MMGTSSEVWLNLQNAYDQKLIELQQVRDFDEQTEIVKQIDYRYFVDVAGLPETRSVKEKIALLCSFFRVSDLRIMTGPDFLVNFRSGSSVNSEKQVINSRAWLQTAMNLAKSIETNPYNEKN